MPRIKRTDNQILDGIIREKIFGAMGREMLSMDDVATKLHMKPATLKAKCNSPRTFTLGELRELSVALKFNCMDTQEFIVMLTEKERKEQLRQVTFVNTLMLATQNI